MFQRRHQLHIEAYLEKGTAVYHIHATGRIKVQEWGKRTQWKAAVRGVVSLETALSSLTPQASCLEISAGRSSCGRCEQGLCTPVYVPG
jgi:hypothetical protein